MQQRLEPATARGRSLQARFAAAVLAILTLAMAGWAFAQDASQVFRFYNEKTGTHFYTISAAERDKVLSNYPWFDYEGAVYWAYTSQQPGTLAVWRFFNTATGTHFYTQSEAEKNYVLATYPVFAFEGAAYYAPADGAQLGSAPLYRFFNTKTGAHFYTTSAAERDLVEQKYPWFVYETVAYYVYSSQPTTPNIPSVNAAPKATLAASATTLTVPATLMLTATASDDDGTVAKVQFYAGNNYLGEAATAPYTFSIPVTIAGSFTFTAVAVDDKGLTGTSNPVGVVATASGGGTPGNIAPQVSLGATQTTFAAPGSTTLTATANDSDGTIANVKFYNGGNLVQTVTQAPYTYTYASSTIGSASFTAVAQDNGGATTTSNAVTITVTSPGGGGGAAVPKLGFTVSSTLVPPATPITLTASNVTSTGGPITRVSFYLNGAKLADKTATPYTFTTTPLAAGTYTFTAEAADAGGGTHMTLPVNVLATDAAQPTSVSPDVWRLLQQATFGPTFAEAQRVQSMGVSAWIDDQFNQATSGYPDAKYNRIQLNQTADCTTQDPNKVAYPADHPYAMCVRDHLSLAMVQRDFFTNAVTKPDQLRQRVAWALSQILVTSGNEPDLTYAHVMSRYQNLMFKHAFGNFENLLNDVTLSPAMGNYLDQVNNDRAAGTRVPNENYAREIMQLFSIGLEELRDDGTVIKDVNGMPVPTYDQTQIKEFAKVFTGLTFADPANPSATTATKKNNRYYALPMIPYPTTATTGHEQSVKNLLNGVTLPAGQAVLKDESDAVHNVFMHANTPVYVGRQLIQRLVTGNPSAAYVQRVAHVFENNGSGVRGDLKAVVKAILTDPEARGGGSASDPTFGSLKEPVLMITGLIRTLSGITDGNGLEGTASALGQRPYYAPTVFNYFPPDNTIQGTTVLAPEFLIHNTQSAIARSNLVYRMVYTPAGVDNSLPNATGTRLHIAQFEPLASNPAALVDKVDQVLTNGQLPAAAKSAVVTAVTAVSATSTTARAQMAVYLIASSYYYQVQH